MPWIKAVPALSFPLLALLHLGAPARVAGKLLKDGDRRG
jgi:hypothetical protein